LASATLSTEGAITICMSPTKIEILEVAGHINGTYTQTNNSTSALPGDTEDLGVEIHNSSSFDEIGLSAAFWYQVGAMSTLGDQNEHDLYGIGTVELHSEVSPHFFWPLEQGVVHLSARCVPLEGLHDTTLFMSFSAKLGITDESFESCFTSDCPELVMLRDSEIHYHDRSVRSCTTDP